MWKVKIIHGESLSAIERGVNEYIRAASEHARIISTTVSMGIAESGRPIAVVTTHEEQKHD